MTDQTSTTTTRYATIAEVVSEYLTHYIDGAATITVDPASVEAVLERDDITSLTAPAAFGGSGTWVASLIRQVAPKYLT